MHWRELTMSDHDKQLQPLPENPTPQDFGFPENPSSTDLVRWERQETFLVAFARTGSVGEACLETGIPVPTVESWDLRDTHGFKKRLAHAKVLALGLHEREIRRRGIEGTDHPVIYQGQITDTYKEYSDNLLMFRAKRLDPSYKDNYQPQQASTAINITQTIIEVRDYRGSNPLPATGSIDAEVRELPGSEKKEGE
jgi:hypothetical protein